MAYPLKMIPIGQLNPYEGNARTHSQEQIDQLKELILMAGFVGPILYDFDADHIIAGHGRMIAAQQLLDEGHAIPAPGRKGNLPKGKLPCIDGTGMSEEERRAFVIADNQVAARAGWDEKLLSFELKELTSAGFNLGTLGFDASDLKNWMTDKTEGETDPDDVPEPPADPVTVLGDVWTLGKHRLVCGDSTDADTVAKCLNGVVPHLMVTDPPYGVNYDPEWRKEAGVNKSDGKMGKVLNDDRADWREAWELFPGDAAYVWHASLFTREVLDSLEACDFTHRSMIIWAKDRFTLGRGDYHWQHEPCWYVVKKNRKGHYVGGRSQSTVWNIPARDDSGVGHGTQKPVECMKRPIENNSQPGDAVYEPFSGSGTTIIAGEMTGRSIHAIELSPAYVDVAVKRWQEFTGQDAVIEHENGDRSTFTEIAEEREKR